MTTEVRTYLNTVSGTWGAITLGDVKEFIAECHRHGYKDDQVLTVAKAHNLSVGSGLIPDLVFIRKDFE